MKSNAPWLVIQSDQDELVEMGQSTTFIDHLKAEKDSGRTEGHRGALALRGGGFAG